MRQILVDHARKNKSAKRGGGVPKAPFEEALAFGSGRSQDLIALDDALNELTNIDRRQCKIIELRFFGGSAWKRPPKLWTFQRQLSAGSSDWRRRGCIAR